jgi:hypothetical protein
MGEWRDSSTIPDLGTRLKWMVSFTHRPLFPWWNSLLHPLDTRLVSPHSWSVRCREVKYCSFRESNPPLFRLLTVVSIQKNRAPLIGFKFLLCCNWNIQWFSSISIFSHKYRAAHRVTPAAPSSVRWRHCTCCSWWTKWHFLQFSLVASWKFGTEIPVNAWVHEDIVKK